MGLSYRHDYDQFRYGIYVNLNLSHSIEPNIKTAIQKKTNLYLQEQEVKKSFIQNELLRYE